MPGTILRERRQIDYYVLIDPRGDGPLVGYYAGHPIPAAVVDYSGRRYVYAGLAPRHRDGSYDVESLRQGEWLVEPGLVYYCDPHEARGGQRKRHRAGQTSAAKSADR